MSNVNIYVNLKYAKARTHTKTGGGNQYFLTTIGEEKNWNMF